MPSPLAHIAAGYGMYRITEFLLRHRNANASLSKPYLLGITIILSLLPDLDAIFGILMGDFGAYHNNISHSMIFGALASLGVIGLLFTIGCAGLKYWFIIALLCYQLHIVMDFFTVGRGVMLLWPVTSARFEFPLKVFYGFHWSQGLVSVKHVWTLVNELGYLVLITLILRFLTKKEIPVSKEQIYSGKQIQS